MSLLVSNLEANIAKIFRGKDEVIRKALICLFSEGHLLIEDIPGVGKTTLALCLAKSLELSFQRIQFTSDLLPSDILGVSIFNPKSGQFEFKSGPIFHNVILADELNRSTPKSQSALLEAMNERQVSQDSTTRNLPKPFFVIATQNPHEQYGTYPLPESQKDRFLMKIAIGYPERKYEKEILREEIDIHAVEELTAVAKKESVLEGIEKAKKVKVDSSLDDYILQIVEETRKSPFLELGVSPRGTLSLRRAACANAFLEGRDYLLPDDIKKVAIPTLAHRVLVKSGSETSGNIQSEKIIQEILDRVPVPI